MILKGEKVILMPLSLEHLPTCWKWIRDKKVTRFLRSDFPKTWRGELKWFRELQEKKDQRMFAIIDAAKKIYIGNIGLHDISHKDRKATIGIMIGEKAYWGKGFGTDAMKTALNYCFKKLKINKISLGVDPENPRAISCYKKCGFKRVGYLKEDDFVRGKFRDSIIMEVFSNNLQ